MSKYRFKTEKEFKRDGLWNKNRPVKWVSVMNKYLGQDIPDKYNQACDKQEKFRYDQWHIEPHDYVLKEIQSEYTVGKWYSCKNWCSSKDFVKLERVYDSQACFTECLNSGKYQKEGQNWWSFTTADPLFEADMSIVSPLLPDGHPDKIVSEKSSFVLPSKWCVKVDRNCQPEEVYKWRQCSWVDAGYINNSATWNDRVLDNYTEITFEQFKQHVLKESPVVETIVETPNQEEDYTGRTIKALVDHPEGTDVKKGETIKIVIKENKDTYILDITARGVSNMRINIPLDLSDWELLPESPKEIDMKEIQEEAKKRFPIGCKFIPADSHKTHTLIEDYCTYEIHGKYIWAHNGHGHLYEDGKWATLVSLPETTKEMFYEGDYIVTLINDANCGKVNYCSKQAKNSDYLQPVIDTKGYPNNGNSKFLSTDTSNTKWRYATPEEAAEYERVGKPYNVTTLQKKEESIPEYVECVKSSAAIITVGKIYNWPNPIDNNGDKRFIDKMDGSVWGFKPSTKEAYDAQYTSKQLANKDLVKGEIYIYDGTQIATYPEGPSISIHGYNYTSNPKWTWCLPITHATEEQKALLRGEIEKRTKKETFIDNVQSVDVMLRTKKKSFKF